MGCVDCVFWKRGLTFWPVVPHDMLKSADCPLNEETRHLDVHGTSPDSANPEDFPWQNATRNVLGVRGAAA
jgi:hypothetical protein